MKRQLEEPFEKYPHTTQYMLWLCPYYHHEFTAVPYIVKKVVEKCRNTKGRGHLFPRPGRFYASEMHPKTMTP